MEWLAGTPYSIDELNKTKVRWNTLRPSHVKNFNSSSDLTKDEYEIAKKTGSRLGKLVLKFND